MSMGLGFAVFVDQTRGVHVPVLGQLFLLLAALVFLALDGHLTLIQFLASSFHSLPIAAGGLDAIAIAGILEWSSQLFSVATRLALPAIAALIVVNLSFGVMSRAAPTLNLFAVGFPVTLSVGFLVLLISLSTCAPVLQSLFEHGFKAIDQLLRALA
jgi:flagellar biosynthetic protein FliR